MHDAMKAQDEELGGMKSVADVEEGIYVSCVAVWDFFQ